MSTALGRELLHGCDDEDAGAAFTTYLNYLEHLSILVHQLHGQDRPEIGVYAATQALPDVVSTKSRRVPDLDAARVQNHLRIAWLREARIHSLGELWDCQPELLPGTPTDAYYAVYHGAQAYLAATGSQQYRDHAAVLKALANIVFQRRVFPQPWSIACTGLPTDGCAEYKGLPAGVAADACHNLVRPSCDTSWSTLCLALRTTRSRQLDRAKADWKRRSKKRRISSAQSAQLADALMPTTLFDFIWRLRVRTDYRDVDAFLVGLASQKQAEDFLNSLLSLLTCTLTVFETLVISQGHAPLLQAAATKFAGSVDPAFSASLTSRPWFTGET